jgi:CheY-like chemotaxis protein
MGQKILWLDNDPGYLKPYIRVLKLEHYEVVVTTTVSEAEAALRADKYDLFILDVMIPWESEEERALYPASSTESGLKMGLRFYERMKSLLEEKGTRVLVMTVRIDKAILDEFKRAGLSEEYFATKTALNEVSAFLEKVASVL